MRRILTVNVNTFDLSRLGHDFVKYYDTETKRNIWTLGYFGGGAVNVVDALDVADQFADEIGVPLGTVKIDEILSSQRFKGFKILFSDCPNQKIPPDANVTTGVYAWLRD